jgi:hypothetical protein
MMYLTMMPETRGLSLLEIRQLFTVPQQPEEQKQSFFQTFMRKLRCDAEAFKD